MEGVRLRVKDIDFARNQIIVREGKGDQDRVTMLAESLAPLLKNQVDKVRLFHAQDVAAGMSEV